MPGTKSTQTYSGKKIHVIMTLKNIDFHLVLVDLDIIHSSFRERALQFEN